jgi:hypothetical protein
MIEVTFIDIPNISKGEIPEDINTCSEDNTEWIFTIYIKLLEYLEEESNKDNQLPPEDECFIINEEDIHLIYDWLENNVYSYLTAKHRFELTLGLGALLQQDGIIDYMPEEMKDS